MFELLKKKANKIFYNSSKNENLNGEETLLLSKFRGDIWKMSNDFTLSEDRLIEELISRIGGFFDTERCVFSRIKGDKIYADIEYKHNRVKGASKGFAVPLELIEKLGVDLQRTVTLEDMMDAISGPKMNFLKPVIQALIAVIGDEPSLSTPVKINGRLFGFITMRFFNSKIEMYTKNVKDVITDAANIIALAIERRRAEEKFRVSFDLNPDAMIITNAADGSIIDVNNGFVSISGYDKNEVIGRNPFEFELLERNKKRSEIAETARKEGPINSGEIKCLTKAGAPIFCLFSSRTINLDGEKCNLTVVKDISDRKEMETKLAASEEKFRVAFNTSPDAINLNRLSDGLYVEINEGFTKLTGYSKKEIEGKTSVEINIWNDISDREKLLAALKGQGFMENLEAKFRLKDGGVKTGLMSARIINMYNEPHIISVTKDITERKITEEKIINTSEKLKEAVEYLERTNAELERFAYVASHDLQEPLRMVSNYAQLLAKKYKGSLGSDADDYIGYMTSGVQRMKSLINDILVFSRVGYGEPQIETVDFNELVNQVAETLKDKAASLNADIEIGQLPVLKCIRSEMFQVFQNLIANSLKFTAAGRKPHIEITAKKNGAEYTFCVSDNGIGIAPQYFNKIFVIFERLHTKDEFEGTGIGLSICKKVIENHGGRIWVESEAGQGASFFFVLPEKD
ncbi:MAG: PAS domain S-box protein [Candidatus Goldbacteria bacterium]|nr:PAS domain S-box protein [Candidatus Goldiibacteriota bacterium]